MVQVMGRPRIHLEDRNITGDNFELGEVRIEEILADDEFNCRGPFTYGSVGELSESIAEHGLQIPVIVWPREEGYMLVAGFRRLKACQMLGMEEILAIIRHDLTERKAHIINLTENIARQDLNPMEEAWKLKRLYPDGASLRDIQKEINQSTRWIHLRLRMLELPEKVQSRLASGTLPLKYVEGLWKIWREKGQKACLQALTEIEKAQSDSGRVVSKKLPEWLRPTYPSHPKKTEIMEVIIKMMEAGIIGLGPRVGAYCAGYISKEELLKDIAKQSQTAKLAELEQRIQELEAEIY